MASSGRRRVRRVDPRAAGVIRIEAVWLAVDPLDMRAGSETILAKVVQVFGAAQPHHAYCFVNRRASWLNCWCPTALVSGWPRDGCTKAASCVRRLEPTRQGVSRHSMVINLLTFARFLDTVWM